MSYKIILNVAGDTLMWIDRFKNKHKDTYTEEVERDETLKVDLTNYENLLTEGMLSFAKKITFEEFLCLTGAFNYQQSDTAFASHDTKSLILDFARNNFVFDRNCEVAGIDKTKLLQCVDEFEIAECYALLEYARRFRNRISYLDSDASLGILGLKKEFFKQAV